MPRPNPSATSSQRRGTPLHAETPLTPARIAGIYGGVGVLWILLSDWALGLVAPAQGHFAALQTVKGWLFVIASGALVYGLARRSLSRIQAAANDARDSRRFMEILIGNLPGVVYRCRHDAAWTMEYLSDECRQLTGYAPGELLGNRQMSYEQLIHPDDRAAVREAVNAAVRERRQFRLTYRILTKAGEERWVTELGRAVFEDEGHPVLLEGFISDITHQRDETQNRRRLAHALDHVADAILITSRDGTIQYVNPAFEEITGYSREEALGANPRILKSGRQDAEFYRLLWAHLLDGQVWSGTLVNRRKNGSLFHARTVISPVRDAAGAIVSFVAVQHDESKERLLHDQLRQAQKMEAVGQLTGGVAHDFNNLLTVVRLNADLLADKLLVDDAASMAILADLRSTVSRGQTLVRQLLGLGRRQTLNVGPVDVVSLVTRLSSALRQLLPETIEIATQLAPSVPPAHGDSNAIEQILMNLATNARDAMPDGGRFEIAVGPVEVRVIEPKHPTWLPAGSYVCVTVTDTGHGMDESTRARIFEPFFTTKPPGVGTGLGMAMVYGLTKQQRGFIDVESEMGKGTVMRLYFPLATESPSLTSPEPLPTMRSAEELRGAETIMIVEDDAALRTAAKRALVQMGYHVLEAGDGEAAIEIYRASGSKIDLVISDITMPRLSGWGLYHAINAGDQPVPFLMVSGYGTEDLAAMRRGTGPAEANDSVPILQKPWTISELLTQVRDVLDRVA